MDCASLGDCQAWHRAPCVTNTVMQVFTRWCSIIKGFDFHAEASTQCVLLLEMTVLIVQPAQRHRLQSPQHPSGEFFAPSDPQIAQDWGSHMYAVTTMALLSSANSFEGCTDTPADACGHQIREVCFRASLFVVLFSCYHSKARKSKRQTLRKYKSICSAINYPQAHL